MTEVDTLAAHIADVLGETEPHPRAQIVAIGQRLGIAFLERVFTQTQEYIAAGGLTTLDGTHQRTPGGIFFKLAKGAMSAANRRRLFDRPEQLRSSSANAVTWHDRRHLLQELAVHGGKANVKIILIGRPERVQMVQKGVVLVMKNDRPPTSLPPELPPIPNDPTNYLVYLTPKAWRRIKPALDTDPNDRAVFEGWARYAPDLRGGEVWVIKASTIGLDRKRREQTQREQ